MEPQARVTVGEKGRIVIPAEIREAMGIRVGDSVELRLEDYELRVSTRRARIRHSQGYSALGRVDGRTPRRSEKRA
jgi:AbrB family looped-hinge helix DNA binding protein